MRKYQIAFLTSIDPTNKGASSGSTHYVYEALKKYVGNVDLLGPVDISNGFITFISRLSKRFSRQYNLSHSFLFAFLYAHRFKNKLRGKHYDFIFAPRSSTEISLLSTNIPIIYYSDTTFKLLYNYYNWFSNFMKISEIEGNIIEKRAISKSAFSIFSSEWAASSAINYYKAPAHKIHVIPFGPNVDIVPTIEIALKKKRADICKLLFVGVEWDRKGGQIAFDTLVELKKMGLSSHLTVLGCVPPPSIMDEDLTVIPFLDKNIKEESERFNRLFEESHFFILPTQQECFGVVFCEASAFGLPSLTTDTGGIGSAVKNNVNGFRFNVTDGGREYAHKIYSIFTDYENSYIPLAVSSREFYDTELNWNKFGTSVLKLMDDYIHNKNNSN